MKYILFFLCWPLLASSQTIHSKDGKIDYAATVMVNGVSKSELYDRAKKALQSPLINDDKKNTIDSKVEDEVETMGRMKLSPTSGVENELCYIVKIKVEEGKYKYHIHKVHLAQFKGGQKVKDIDSKDLLDGMKVSGEPSRLSEKQLNEIDMNLQKLIAMIRANITNTAVSKSDH